MNFERRGPQSSAAAHDIPHLPGRATKPDNSIIGARISYEA